MTHWTPVLVTRHSGSPCKNADLRDGERAAYVISIGGSAGAFEELKRLLRALPARCPAAVAVALHSGPSSVLADALRPTSVLPVEQAISGTLLRAGYVYVAPPRTHLIINPDGRLSVSDAPPIRRFRPSCDWLFESAAASYGDRHVAIVLSGLLSDGALKLRAVKRAGGVVLVQDPATCRFGSMPNAAIATGEVDQTLSIDDMPRALEILFSQRHSGADRQSWEDPFVDRLAEQPA